MPNLYRVGVCQIVAKDNPDLRGKGGCWCVVSAVNDFSCTVVAWDGSYNFVISRISKMSKMSKLSRLKVSESEAQQKSDAAGL